MAFRTDSLNTEDLEAQVLQAKRRLEGKCSITSQLAMHMKSNCRLLRFVSARQCAKSRPANGDTSPSRSSPACAGKASSRSLKTRLIPKPKGEPGRARGYTFKTAVLVPPECFNLWKVCVLSHLLICSAVIWPRQVHVQQLPDMLHPTSEPTMNYRTKPKLSYIKMRVFSLTAAT